jgi:D-arginine dehydrogenase
LAGAATAYYLSLEKAGSVLLLEQEASLGVHASGNNASMIRQLVSDEVIGRLAVHSTRLIQSLSEEEEVPPYFTSYGSLLVASPEDQGLLKEIAQVAQKNRLEIVSESREEVLKRIPVLETLNFTQALFCPQDGVVNTQALLDTFKEGGQKRGVTILTHSCLKGIERHTGDGYSLDIEQNQKSQILKCKTLINAAGAWSNQVAQLGGVSPKPLRAYKRHLFWSAQPETFDPTWPYMWDLSQQFYFRPYAPNELLLSPCDQEECEPVVGKVNTSGEAEVLLRKKLEKSMPSLLDSSFKRVSAELRTLSSDGRFVIGPDPEDPQFFWVGGLGGHGVTTSAGVGELAAQLLLKKDVDSELSQRFSPSRF